jgi:hypothetical protein
VNIYNQCSDFDLEDGEYFSTGTIRDEYFYNKVFAGRMTSIDLKPFLSTFGATIMYRLKKGHVKSTNTLLFVAWKSEGYKRLRVLLQVIECDKTFPWDGSKVEEYCQRYASQLSTCTGPIKDTWLISDSTMLMTELELDFTQRDGVLNINISEGIKDERTKLPEWINLKRYVLLESKMF